MDNISVFDVNCPVEALNQMSWQCQWDLDGDRLLLWWIGWCHQNRGFFIVSPMLCRGIPVRAGVRCCYPIWKSHMGRMIWSQSLKSKLYALQILNKHVSFIWKGVVCGRIVEILLTESRPFITDIGAAPPLQVYRVWCWLWGGQTVSQRTQ